jgi:uncharacterized protein involved in exopolysaccharide biosynthesis
MHYDFMQRYDMENMEETIEQLSDNIDITVEDELQIAVSFWDKNQDEVAPITKYIINCLDSLNIILTASKAKKNREFIESRVNDVLDSIKSLETEITEYMNNEGILSLTDQITVGVQNAAALKAEIMAKEIELAIANNTYDKNNPIIKNLTNEISSYKSKYQEFFETNPDDKLMPNFLKIPEIGIHFSRLERQVQYYLKIMEFLAPEYENAKIEEAKKVPTIQLLDRPVRPEKKDKPKRSIIVLASMFLSFIFSLYYIHWKENISKQFSISKKTN